MSYFPNRYSSLGSGAQCFLALLSVREAPIWLSATRSSLRESRGQVSQDHLAVPQHLIVKRLSAHNRILGFHMSSLKVLTADLVSCPLWWKVQSKKNASLPFSVSCKSHARSGTEVATDTMPQDYKRNGQKNLYFVRILKVELLTLQEPQRP